MGLGAQMVAVAIGWQVYEIDRNPFHLGLVGLAEFLPLPLLALPAGHLADRLPRRLVFVGELALLMVVAAFLIVVTLAGASTLWPFLGLAGALGVASAVGSPASRALPPTLVPTEILAAALALRSTAVQGAIVVGPAVGGVLFAVRAELVYVASVVLFAAALVCVLALREPRVPRRRDDDVGLESVLQGIAFIRRTPVLLGAISLDLVAVLLGGAVALLPLFARDVLHVGPEGLGLLRSAPAVGALIAGVMLTRRPLRRRVGRTLLVVVGVFGASMLVFGLSRSFALSLFALAVSGFADMISMNIRATVVAMATPEELLGRVNAVEMVFISASNELGAFESGAAAALVGAVPAVVVGGALTICAALAWPLLFRELDQVDGFETLRPEAVPSLAEP
jgi:predicted MFS family arabinose efflux permease